MAPTHIKGLIRQAAAMTASPPMAENRALLLILDSAGCGRAPDAAAYGDAGADTLGHIFAQSPGLTLPAEHSRIRPWLARSGRDGSPSRP